MNATDTQLTRAEMNRLMVAGRLAPAAAQQAVVDLYTANPTTAARLVAPDQIDPLTWEVDAAGKARAKEPHAAPTEDVPPPADESPVTPATLGAYLRSLREAAGLTADGLARKVKSNGTTIKGYEAGTQRMTTLMADRLTAFFDADADLMRRLVAAQEIAPRREVGSARRAATGPIQLLPEPQPDTNTEKEIQAFPRLAWRDEAYRIVRVFEANAQEADLDPVGPYVVERASGRDAMGQERWLELGGVRDIIVAFRHMTRALAERG